MKKFRKIEIRKKDDLKSKKQLFLFHQWINRENNTYALLEDMNNKIDLYSISEYDMSFVISKKKDFELVELEDILMSNVELIQNLSLGNCKKMFTGISEYDKLYERGRLQIIFGLYAL